MNTTTYRTIVKAGLALCLFAIAAVLAVDDLPNGFGAVDLIQYWSASRAALSGENPYDPQVLWRIQQSKLDELAGPVLMWNPPLIFPLVVWSARLEFVSFVSLWFLLSCAVYGICVVTLLRRFLVDSSNRTQRYLAIGSVCTFYPIALSVSYGQMGPLLLASWLTFLLMSESISKSFSFVAGIALAPTIVKPHLLYLVYTWIGIKSLHSRSFAWLCGLLFATACLIGGVFLINANIFDWYWAALGRPPIYFKTPTLGSWLQELFSNYREVVRGLPTLLGVVVLSTIFALTKEVRDSKHMLLILVPWSLFSSPYGWVYDQVLLLPTVVWLAGTRSVSVGALVVLANCTMALTPERWGQQWGVWYSLVIGLLALEAGASEVSQVNVSKNSARFPETLP